ncbi:MAG: tRNA lysidine(34) synthetase TilS [Candidatus Cloacimonetes bacterium HGW-Cloacimonetes-1]|jgi:tRNA(Ile)-lysidine synthase|nr:MAG: tRNA lysidine(34) synthetase TilS [Candidatus Cloacimonetes bacterium HGW-Cloacimonetes-1]
MAEIAGYFKRFETYVSKEDLISRGDKILVGFSGGADSTALLYLLSRLRSKFTISILAVHINHQLRGTESLDDENYCKQICLQNNIPLIVRRAEFKDHRDLENQARLKRQEVFSQILKMYRFDKVAMAHHKNDQAETVLMNLFRGTGINGMAGIKPQSGSIIHPLLCFDKSELLEILRTQHISWQEDSSNKLNNFKRNKIRNELIPSLEENYNPLLVEKLSTQAEIFRHAETLLKSSCSKKLKKITLEHSPEMITISITGLMKLCEIERFYCFKQIYSTISKLDSDFYMHSYHELISLCGSSGSKYSMLQHGVFVKKQYNELSFSKERADEASENSEVVVIEDDRSRAVHMGFRFTFKHLKVVTKSAMTEGGKFSVIIDYDKLSMPLTIRSRQAGDRFSPLGLGHDKKLKEFFIDEKVPKFERDKIPILEDSSQIIWIVGHRLDERVKCDEETCHYLQITAEPVHLGRNRAASRK